MHYPLVSVGIPAHNSYGTIVDALTSIVSQDYPRLEILISDDCSSDNTQELCTQISRSYPGIRYFRHDTRIGLARNFEFVLKEARGELFMWVAHDDALEPGILKKYVECLVNHPEYSLVSGRIRYVSGKRPVFVENGFNLIGRLPVARVISYYFQRCSWSHVLRPDQKVHCAGSTHPQQDW